MRKLIFGLAILSVSYNFSFYKMFDIFIDGKSNAKKIGSSYVINTDLGYGLFYDLNSYEKPLPFDLLKTNPFDKVKWQQLCDDFCNRNIKIIFFNVESSKNKNISELKFNRYNLGSFSFGKPMVLESDRKYKKDSKIEIDQQQNDVSLKNCTTGKTIKFEEAFKNFARRQKELYEIDLPHVLARLIVDSKFPDINDKNEIETRAVSEMMKLNKFTYTDDQIELLENSEILAIWALPDKSYSNKDYVKNWNLRHPNDLKEVEYKKINHIIIGYAVDKKTNETFNFVTDLGQDISVLFDDDTKKRKRSD